jgi:hypothetical protein
MRRLLEEWCEDDFTLLYYVSEALVYVGASIALIVAVWFCFIPWPINLVALLMTALLLGAFAHTVPCIMHKLRKLRSRGRACLGAVA